MITDFEALRAIGWPCEATPKAGDWAQLMSTHAHSRPARVIEQHRSGYVVAEGPGNGFTVESLPDWQRPRLVSAQRPAVGDWLLITGEPGHNAKAVALLPRRTSIKRAAAGEHYGQQLIAANIDTVFVVCGLDADFNPRRIERYLLLIGGGAHPVIVLTKADSASEFALDDSHAALAEITAQDIDFCRINAKDADSVACLHRWLTPGTTAVVVGSSGAGKSTLTNTLLGSERMRTGAVRANDARGRHTTTYRTLLPLATGACLIDTPGMRELKPTGEEDLGDGGFADVEALATQCRFRNCRHNREPGCALHAAIEKGTLDANRVDNYLKLEMEISGAANRSAAAQAPDIRQKASAKNVRGHIGAKKRRR